MLGFVVGAVAGSIAAYLYRDEIAKYMNDRFPRVRNTAAERIGTLGEAASSALDRARHQIDSTVRTSQERLRATGTTGSTGSTMGPTGSMGSTGSGSMYNRPGSDRPGT
jgi:hypothetical protein